MARGEAWLTQVFEFVLEARHGIHNRVKQVNEVGVFWERRLDFVEEVQQPLHIRLWVAVLVELDIVAADDAVPPLIRLCVSVNKVGDGIVIRAEPLMLGVGLRGEMLQVRDGCAVQHRANEQGDIFLVRCHSTPIVV